MNYWPQKLISSCLFSTSLNVALGTFVSSANTQSIDRSRPRMQWRQLSRSLNYPSCISVAGTHLGHQALDSRHDARRHLQWPVPPTPPGPLPQPRHPIYHEHHPGPLPQPRHRPSTMNTGTKKWLETLSNKNREGLTRGKVSIEVVGGREDVVIVTPTNHSPAPLLACVAIVARKSECRLPWICFQTLHVLALIQELRSQKNSKPMG